MKRLCFHCKTRTGTSGPIHLVVSFKVPERGHNHKEPKVFSRIILFQVHFRDKQAKCHNSHAIFRSLLWTLIKKATVSVGKTQGQEVQKINFSHN